MASRSASRLYDRALSQAGLRATGFAILSVLATEDATTVSGLTERLAMDRTTCTRGLAPLVSKQAVTAEYGDASIHDLLTGLRRLLASSERRNSA